KKRGGHVERSRHLSTLFYAAALTALRMAAWDCCVCFNRSGPPCEVIITFSTLPKIFGFCIFSRSSFKNGSILAKIKNISPEKLPSRKSSRLRVPCSTKEEAISQYPPT